MSNVTVPPQALEAEESVLGAIMLGNAHTLDAVSSELRPEHFYRSSHATIYRAALELYARNEPTDAIALEASLQAHGKLDEAGGKQRLHELAGLVPPTANAGHWARIIRQQSERRHLILVGNEIAKLGWQPAGEVAQAIERAQQLTYDLTSEQAAGAVDLEAAVRSVVDEIRELEGNPRKLLGVPTGLLDLDHVTRGFRKGDLIVVAADTGRGKSALALNAAVHLAVWNEKPVAFYSLEMSPKELVGRALALLSRIPHDRLTRGDIKPNEWRALMEAANQLAQAPLELKTDALIRPAGLRSQLRQWRNRNPEGALAIVDYLQLLTPDEKTDNRTSDVSAISRALKTTAMNLELPILAVSQLRRRMPNTRPHRNELRESGSIENDASVVVLIHHPEEREGIAELIVAKNRHGAERTVDVQWSGPLMRFSGLLRDTSGRVAA